jgi:hypothetical protein
MLAGGHWVLGGSRPRAPRAGRSCAHAPDIHCSDSERPLSPTKCGDAQLDRDAKQPLNGRITAMLRIKILAPCALTILALFAVAPAQSSALLGFPEFGRCVKVAPGTGNYLLSSCTGGAKPGGEYNFEPLVKPTFAGTGGVTVLETVSGLKIECKKVIDEGEYGSDDIELTAHLIGCKDLALNFECSNAAPEEILMLKLVIELEFLSNHLNKKGKLVVSVGAPIQFEEPHIYFECGPNKNKFTLSGIAIAPVSPIDKMSKTLSLKLKEKSGKQMPNKLGSSKLVPVLQQTFPPLPPEEAGLSSINTLTYAEASELKAAE